MAYFRNRKDFLSFYGPVFGGGGPPGPQLEQKFDVQCLRSIPCFEYMSEKKEYRFPDRLARPTDNASIVDQRGSKESVLCTGIQIVVHSTIVLYYRLTDWPEDRCKEHHIQEKHS